MILSNDLVFYVTPRSPVPTLPSRLASSILGPVEFKVDAGACPMIIGIFRVEVHVHGWGSGLTLCRHNTEVYHQSVRLYLYLIVNMSLVQPAD